MDKITKETIKEIKKRLKGMDTEEKNEYYDQVYYLYGRDIFKKIVPVRYKNEDINTLLEEGKFQDIYFKYGEDEYNKYLAYMRQQDVLNETGSKSHSFVSKFTQKVNDFFRRKLPSVLVTVGIGLPVALPAMGEKLKMDEYSKNAEKIEQYIDNINEYGKNVKEMNLTQTEIMMKVMDDMWKNIKGYGDPEIDLISYAGLDLATKEGQGVCRNMADDIARKLNAIDKDYNARVITVYSDTQKKGYTVAGIEQNVITNNDTVIAETQNNEENQEMVDFFIKVVGNHAIVALESKEDNATLLLDPTNPGIGIYKDGNIVMFNTDGYKEQEKVTFERTYFKNVIADGFEGYKVPFELLNTFRNPNLSMEELKEKYGLEAQNTALESVREKTKTFKDTIKIDLKNGDTVRVEFEDSKENIKEDFNLEK